MGGNRRGPGHQGADPGLRLAPGQWITVPGTLVGGYAHADHWRPRGITVYAITEDGADGEIQWWVP